MSLPILIDRPCEWLEDHDKVRLDFEEEPLDILCANRHGDMCVGEPGDYWEVNISNSGVEVL